MIDVWNRVMTNIGIAVTGVEIHSSESDLPSSFPALYVTQISARDHAMDLENSETGVTSEIRIQSFSSNGLSEARDVIAQACDAMRIMGYVRTFGPREIENVSDRNVKRCEARFRRFVADISNIPKFETG
jgi:hypothetical protein